MVFLTFEHTFFDKVIIQTGCNYQFLVVRMLKIFIIKFELIIIIL